MTTDTPTITFSIGNSQKKLTSEELLTALGIPVPNIEEVVVGFARALEKTGYSSEESDEIMDIAALETMKLTCKRVATASQDTSANG